MEEAILNGEKSEAEIAEPPGESGHGKLNNIIGQGVSDDFFHIMCHVDLTLFRKIEAGEFVDLDRLLPREKLAGSNDRVTDEARMEWVQRNGNTFLVPANRESKINGFRKWEQAFRVYATIYCGMNPHWAREIWQYISAINTVANAYHWDNVYNYDITFSRLMAFNTNRSRAITYNQMWNLSMRDPLPKSSGRPASGRAWSGRDHATSPNANIRMKPDYCWNFNKEIKCKFGNKCKFIERCSYCDSPNHGVVSCTKLQKKQGSKRGHKGNTSHSHGHRSGSSNSSSNSHDGSK